MLQQRLTRNLYTGQTEPLTAPLSFDFTEDLGDKRNLSLLSQYGGAAAAYSLRALGSYNEHVVRVRRASDNDEKDFTASQVSSGEMVNWVNSQTVPPLDIGKETEDGRIPVPEGGDSIGTPAAAYSLRNLSTTYTGNVVDVRRNSDGNTQGFTAEEVNDGTLEAWVNTSFASALPLDTASGAAAAYSLRNLSSSYTGDVVDVRRSSDGTEESFTAEEVSDGTLEAWVDTEYTFYTSDFSADVDGWGASSCIITPNVDEDSDGSGQPPSDNWLRISASDRLSIANNRTSVDNVIKALGGGTYKVEVDYYAPETVNNHKVIVFTGEGNFSSASVTFAQGSGSRTYSLDLSEAAATSLTSFRIGSTNTYPTGTLLYFKNIRIRKVDANGHVSKWYDQSGNTNHAIQGTPANQPKIVEGGSLVKDSKNNPEIDFNGLQSLIKYNPSGFSGKEQSHFVKFNPTSSVGYLVELEGGTGAARSISVEPYLRFNLVTQDYDSAVLSGDSLLSMVCPDTPTTIDDYDLYYQGSLLTPDSLSGGVLANVTSSAIYIGRVSYSGRISEVISYNSDQSDKRRAIEENIGATYGISVTSSKDGYVSKWYDQSGNDNHAVQTTPANQPTIVEGGSLVTGGIDFDGVDDKLNITSTIPLSSNDFFFTSVLKVLDGDGEDITPIGHPVGNRFLISIDYDNDSAQMRTDDGSFLVQPFQVGEPTGYISATVQRVGNSAKLFHQGSDTVTFDVTGESFTLGNLGQWLPSSYSKHSIQELIIYDSDQSDNRTAIEANIGETYGITGIPAYTDTVDGFVETWYDQSGNGNHATQSVAGEQPKIVDGGSLVVVDGTPSIDFDGTDDSLDYIGAIGVGNDVTVYSVLKNIDDSSRKAAFNIGGYTSFPTSSDSATFDCRQNDPNFRYGDGAIDLGASLPLVSYLATARPFLANPTLTVNGSIRTGSANTRTISDNSFLIGRGIAGATPISGSIKEMIVYSDNVNQTGIEANIADQYGITLS